MGENNLHTRILIILFFIGIVLWGIEDPFLKKLFFGSVFNEEPYTRLAVRVYFVALCMLLLRVIFRYGKLQEELHRNEEKFRLLYEEAPLAYQSLDGNGNFIIVNQSWLGLLGYSLTEVLGRNFSEFLAPGYSEKFHENFPLFKSKGEIRNIEFVMTCKTGEDILVSADGVISRYPDGAFKQTHCILRNITDQRKMEKALWESNERYRAVIDSISLGIALIGPDKRILSCNAKIKEWFPDFDVAANPLCFKVFRNLTQENECSDCPVIKTFADGKVHEFKTQTLRGDTLRHLRILTSPMLDRGRVVAVIKTVEDVTEQKIIEQEIRSYQKKLRLLSLELFLVEERERRRIATYLHDSVSQPLAIAKIKLRKFRESLSHHNDQGTLDQVFQLIEQSIQCARTMTFELSPPILYELGFEAAVEWCAEETQKQCGIVFCVEREGETVQLDNEVSTILFKVVRELLINVVKHSHATKAVVYIAKKEGTIRIMVKDDGTGFDAAKVNSLSGFGLFDIREKLMYLGGSVSINSKPSCGTIVTLISPLRYRRDS